MARFIGTAGRQALVAGGLWIVVALALGASALATLGVLIVAASWGFLLHNTPPARIFMGDVGSAFLGFSLASLAVIGGLADARASWCSGPVFST